MKALSKLPKIIKKNLFKMYTEQWYKKKKTCLGPPKKYKQAESKMQVTGTISSKK